MTLIYAEFDQKGLKKGALELIKKAGELGDEVCAVVVGKSVGNIAAELSKYSLTKIFTIENEILEKHNVILYADVLEKLIGELSPKIFLGSASFFGRDLFARLAARLNTGLLSDCIELRLEDALIGKRPVYAGKAHIEAKLVNSPIMMATIRPNVLDPATPTDGASPEIIKKDIEVTPIDILKIVDIIASKSERPDLTEALFIVSGGRGMKEKDNFKILEALADLLHGTVGASRAAVDAGYAEQSTQVGQTGKVVNPSLYIACGISGAIQHLAGMRTSKCIVAINKDPDAPIFQIADYGIVGDLFSIVPLLTEQIKKAKS